jgi:prolipoprotein diacylglyceryltransferase
MQIGSWQIWPFTLRLGLGTTLALLWLWIVASRRNNVHRWQMVSVTWLVALGALLIGRFGYVIEQRAYFSNRPGDIIALREVGGLHGTGAWIGGLLAFGIDLLRTKQTKRMLPLFMPAALLISAGAWWGCADAGCAWGRPALTAPGWAQWLIVEAPDLYHTIKPRYAVQPIAALSALLMSGLAILWPQSGLLFGAGYMLSVVGLTVLRADPAPTISGYRLDSLTHLILALIFIGLHLWYKRTTE